MRKLDGLLEFIAVIEHGGFNAAAEHLNVSASYVSRRVSELEQRLGVRLLHRTTRRIQLTDIGAQYLERSRDVLDRIAEIEADVAEQQSLIIGTVRIAAGGWYGERVVARVVAEFAHRHPRLLVDLEISDRRVDLIREGFDLAIRHGPPGDPNLIARQIASRRMRVCAAPHYLADRGRPHTPQDLANHVCLTAPFQPWRFMLDGKVDEMHVEGPLVSNNGPGLREAALVGLGIVRLPEIYLEDAIADGRLSVLLEPYEVPPSPTYLVYPSRERMPFRVRSLIDHLVEALAERD
jgi:LysR family transcriptional regulator, transcriptional activator for dmlA